MAYPISIPFYAFKLHLSPGKYLLAPMTDSNALRLGEPLHLVAGRYAEDLQRKVLDKGVNQSLLDEYRGGDFLRGKLKVAFPAARDQISFPAFELEFDYYYNRQERGAWGIIPVLGIETFTPKLNDLEKRLEDALRLEFARNGRLHAVQDVVASIWYEEVELLQQEINLKTLGPKEVEEQQESPGERLLPQVARSLHIQQRISFGRRKALDQMTRALKNEFNRNVLVVGPSGVGKTALIWELSRQCEERKIPGKIWETTASTLIKELTRDTGWQDNLGRLCREMAGGRDLLFVRNLMELFEVGKYEGNEVSIADYLRSYLSRGDITLISECTEEEMALIELKSPNYLSLFQLIRLEEPRKNLEQIILKKLKTLAADKAAKISEEAIRETIRLNRRFMPYSGMPGKPIRFLESLLINESGRGGQGKPATIKRSEVIRYFCEDSGLPAFIIDPGIPMDTERIRTHFNDNVFGQEAAVDHLVDLLASVKTALTRTGKPIASLLFAGPTGVGKTELAKVLAEFMFGHRDRLTRFDMSEFSSPFAVMRLIGSTYFSEGLLASAVRRQPFSVLLFDEIEKAHESFYDLLLQILSEGRLTDSQGKLVNFCSTIIIMTSNIGAEDAYGQRIGWSRENAGNEIQSGFLSAVQRHFRPELFNRIDQVIPFSPLDRLTIRYIIDREIRQLYQREGIKFRRMHLEIEEPVFDHLAEAGYNNQYGARHLQRTIREKLVIPLARILNTQDSEDQLLLRVVMKNYTPSILLEADPLGIELLLEELDKIQQADEVSELRRKIYRLRESPSYIHLLNEIELLERKKERKKKRFWENQTQADRYSLLLETREKIRALTREVENLEMELSLAGLDLSPYDTGAVNRATAWKEAFFGLKVDLFRRLNPDQDRCFLKIYGVRPAGIASFYKALLDRLGYEYTAVSVWFKETSPQKTVPDEIYAKKQIVWKEFPQIIEDGKRGMCYGIEFKIEGPAAFLYLQEESGFQEWRLDSREKTSTYQVLVEKEAHPVPEKIHRKEYYQQQSARRLVDRRRLTDNLYKIKRELAVSERLDFLIEHLDRRFEVKLNLEIL